MKTLIITPIYEINGRENLFHDSSAVHYLLKHWPEKNEILVIYTYFNSIKKISRYLNYKERKYHKNGYNYTTDEINVEMIETQLLPKQKWLNKFQVNRIKKHINKKLVKHNFTNIDKVICHIPCYFGIQYISSIKSNEKIAILHSSDVKKQKISENYVKELDKHFDRIYTRSKPIYNFFKDIKLKKLKEEIIFSGAPENFNSIIERKQKKTFNILYVGKMIKRKNIDLIITALSKIKNKNYNFLIIGDGPEKNNLSKLISNFKLEKQIQIIKKLSRTDVLKTMQESDIFIMPSINETLGLVYLEAMSQGCITIGTINEGIDGIIVNKKNGFLVNPTTSSILEVLNYIFKLECSEINKISNEAIKTSKEYTEEKKGKEYYNIIFNKERNKENEK